MDELKNENKKRNYACQRHTELIINSPSNKVILRRINKILINYNENK